MFVLLFTIFIDLVGFAIVFPILPFLAQQYGADARLVTLLIAVYSALQIVGAPVWGRVSDHFGRKRVLLLTLAGGGLGYLWFGLAGSLTGLFLARAFGGAMAGNVAVAQAYLADLTTPEERSAAMAKIGAAFGLAFVVGPGLGGVLAGADPEAPNFLLPCLVAAGLSFAACLLGLVILREPARHSESAGPPSMAEVMAALERRRIFGLVALMAIVSLVFSMAMAIYPLWLDARFGWGPREVGYVFTLIGLAVTVIQGGLIGPLTRLVGDWWGLAIGAAALVAALAMVSAISATPGLVLHVVALCLGISLCNPILTGLVSKATKAEHQGATLGLASAGTGSGRIAGPLLSGALFAGLGADWPLLVGAALILPVLLGGLWMALRE
ncbi:MAG: MFS transporter [Alphaproteobacteria bacterium]|jgi:MFS family permease|nr:MFS transporter [Alphaproteobacteria bacterium]